MFNLRAIFFHDLPGSSYFMDEYSGKFDFAFGDAEYTLVKPERVLAKVKEALAELGDDEEPPERKDLQDLAAALEGIPDTTLIAFDG